jgi:hypothetical protein
MDKTKMSVLINFLKLILYGFQILFVRLEIPEHMKESFREQEKELEEELLNAFDFRFVEK